ncbi:collagen alpha-1(I) chain-like [Antechinus flavipes]|uniref:collagen alpha-1(I) chain-like n=1 Tax=Antechinus flavipes TaxID=38775 RepID=UPI002235B332|nr:collagen alpha-1(I) chain-like [Antechinus flavipes]
MGSFPVSLPRPPPASGSHRPRPPPASAPTGLGLPPASAPSGLGPPPALGPHRPRPPPASGPHRPRAPSGLGPPPASAPTGLGLPLASAPTGLSPHRPRPPLASCPPHPDSLPFSLPPRPRQLKTITGKEDSGPRSPPKHGPSGRLHRASDFVLRGQAGRASPCPPSLPPPLVPSFPERASASGSAPTPAVPRRIPGSARSAQHRARDSFRVPKTGFSFFVEQKYSRSPTCHSSSGRPPADGPTLGNGSLPPPELPTPVGDLSCSVVSSGCSPGPAGSKGLQSLRPPGRFQIKASALGAAVGHDAQEHSRSREKRSRQTASEKDKAVIAIHTRARRESSAQSTEQNLRPGEPWAGEGTGAHRTPGCQVQAAAAASLGASSMPGGQLRVPGDQLRAQGTSSVSGGTSSVPGGTSSMPWGPAPCLGGPAPCLGGPAPCPGGQLCARGDQLCARGDQLRVRGASSVPRGPAPCPGGPAPCPGGQLHVPGDQLRAQGTSSVSGGGQLRVWGASSVPGGTSSVSGGPAPCPGGQLRVPGDQLRAQGTSSVSGGGQLRVWGASSMSLGTSSVPGGTSSVPGGTSSMPWGPAPCLGGPAPCLGGQLRARGDQLRARGDQLRVWGGQLRVWGGPAPCLGGPAPCLGGGAGVSFTISRSSEARAGPPRAVHKRKALGPPRSPAQRGQDASPERPVGSPGLWSLWSPRELLWGRRVQRQPGDPPARGRSAEGPSPDANYQSSLCQALGAPLPEGSGACHHRFHRLAPVLAQRAEPGAEGPLGREARQGDAGFQSPGHLERNRERSQSSRAPGARSVPWARPSCPHGGDSEGAPAGGSARTGAPGGEGLGSQALPTLPRSPPPRPPPQQPFPPRTQQPRPGAKPERPGPPRPADGEVTPVCRGAPPGPGQEAQPGTSDEPCPRQTDRPSLSPPRPRPLPSRHPDINPARPPWVRAAPGPGAAASPAEVVRRPHSSPKVTGLPGCGGQARELPRPPRFWASELVGAAPPGAPTLGGVERAHLPAPWSGSPDAAAAVPAESPSPPGFSACKMGEMMAPLLPLGAGRTYYVSSLGLLAC